MGLDYLRLLSWGLSFGLVLSGTPKPASADSGAEAAVLSAEALILELDGDPTGALELMRKAYGLDSGDPAITFDLARMAFEEAERAGGNPARADIEPFLGRPPENGEEQKLRAYLLALEGDAQGALATLQGPETQPPAAPADPVPEASGDELAQMRAELGAYLDAMKDQQPDRLNLSLLIAGQGDTNITLDPNAVPSDRGGIRTLIRGGLVARPFESLPRLEGRLTLESSIHLSNRDVLSGYDSIYGLAQVSYGTDIGALNLYTELYGSHIRARGADVAFMNDIGAVAELRLPLSISPGVYVDVGYRDFVLGNPEDTIMDRDGARAAAGVMGEWIGELFGFSARIGFQSENAQGLAMAQRGIDLALFASVQWKWLEAVAGFSYEWRNYPESPLRRVDSRLMPQVDVHLNFVDWLSIQGGYFMVRNLSVNAADYTRHVATLGVEGRY